MNGKLTSDYQARLREIVEQEAAKIDKRIKAGLEGDLVNVQAELEAAFEFAILHSDHPNFNV